MRHIYLSDGPTSEHYAANVNGDRTCVLAQLGDNHEQVRLMLTPDQARDFAMRLEEAAAKVGTDGSFPEGVHLQSIRDRLRVAWSARTSADPQNWTETNPAWGQCAVTACLVEDLVGGDVVWAEAKLPDGRHITHYFNRVDGKELDLTFEQFPMGTVVPEGLARREGGSAREYVLSFERTQRRYDELCRWFTHGKQSDRHCLTEARNL
jgi:hypothetical protein